MNIDQFRAMKAQEKEQANAQTQPSANGDIPTEQTKVETPPSVPTQKTEPNQDSQTQVEPEQTLVVDEPSNTTPTEIEIDGVKVSLDELKNGYMRQSDYTKKTQEISKKAREAEQALQLMQHLESNPEVAQQLAQQFQLPTIDPNQKQLIELQNQNMELLIRNELRDLKDKYGEFNEIELLNVARDEQISNLDTAYQVLQARKGGGASKPQEMDVESLREQIKQELLAELKKTEEQQVDTSTIIQSGGDVAPVRDTAPQLSPQEQKVARAMGMKIEEYAKWRDIKKKK